MGKGNLDEDKKLFDCSVTRSDWEKEIWWEKLFGWIKEHKVISRYLSVDG